MVLNVKPKILKPLEENIWGNLYDLEAGKILARGKNKSHKRKKKDIWIALWNTSFKKQENKPWTGKTYFQNTKLIEYLYPDYMKNSQNSKVLRKGTTPMAESLAKQALYKIDG